MTLLLVVVGACVGAPLRYLTDRGIQTRHETVFPWGTLSVNVVASLILGIVAGAGSHWGPTTSALIGTGFCGALSTYSTFSFETLRLMQQGARFAAAVNVGVSLVAGVGAAAVGWSIGMSVT